MMRSGFLFLLIFPFSVFAQFSNPYEELGTDEGVLASKHLYLSGNYSINSTALTNRMFNTLLFGDFISEEVKDNSLQYLRESNRAGAYGNFTGFFSWQHGKGDRNNSVNLFVTYYERGQLGALFDKDLYKLVFYGNTDYAGKTAEINNTMYRRINYASLGFGLYKVKSTHERKIVYGASLGAVNGKSLVDYQVSNLDLYTSSSGDSLSLDVDYKRTGSVPDSNVFYKVSGLGAAFSFFVNAYLNKDDLIHFSVSDLGFVNWTNRVDNFTINSNYSFTGFEVDLFSESLSTLNVNYVFDSLRKEADASRNTDAFTTVLPAQIALKYVNRLNERFTTHIGGYYITGLYHRPELFASLDTRIVDNWKVNAGFSLFGYGRYGVLLSTDLRIKERFHLRAGTDHLEAYIVPANTFGQGLFVGLLANLK